MVHLQTFCVIKYTKKSGLYSANRSDTVVKDLNFCRMIDDPGFEPEHFKLLVPKVAVAF